MRALLVVLHLTAVISVACPAPVRTMPDSSWKRPAVQEEVLGWTTRLAKIGIRLTPDELQSLSTDIQRQWIDARRAILGPALTYLRVIGATQAWYMFTGPDKEPQRFVLSFTTARDDGGTEAERVFELGYELEHPELLHADFLDDHRVRRVMFQTSWGKSESTFRIVCQALDVRLRKQREDVVDTVCQLVGRPVEHPYRRERKRTDSIAREIAVHKDGSIDEAKDGRPSKRRLPAKKRTPSSSSSPSAVTP